MPQYDYKCEGCNSVQTIERSIHAESSSPMCVTCNKTMVQVYSVPGLKFNGSGFYSTGG
jgi:putative FmdB family regulatory protein